MTTIDTNELRKLAEAATPGPWKAEKYGITGAGDRDVVSWDYALNDTDRGSEGTDKEFIAAANPTTILSLLDRLAAMTERAEKTEKALSDCAASVRYAGEAPVLEGGLAENIPASVGLALMRLKKRAEVAERERDEATVQMHGAGVRADNAERREAHIRTALAGAEATIAKLREAMPGVRVRSAILTMRGMTLPKHVLLPSERDAVDIVEQWVDTLDVTRLDAARGGAK